MTKVLILGSTGMLGSMVLDYLSKKEDLIITAPLRKELDKLSYKNYDYIINCIGIIKQKLDNPEEAIRINSLFPYELSRKAPNAKIIQIATDCVFSGETGNYKEFDEHNALDIYGKTKSLGEVKDKNFYNIRCSIIGFDKKKVSLLSWFLSQKKVNGYLNHYWNGITTLHFANICYSIIENKLELPNVIHFIPKNKVSKYQLLEIIAKKFNKKIEINAKTTTEGIDRTLSTSLMLNRLLWNDMGYEHALTIEQMVEELAEYVKK